MIYRLIIPVSDKSVCAAFELVCAYLESLGIYSYGKFARDDEIIGNINNDLSVLSHVSVDDFSEGEFFENRRKDSDGNQTEQR